MKSAQETIGIALPKLDSPFLYIVGYADAAFANNYDMASQLGFIVVLKNKNDPAAIVHYGSWKCSRVTRSVLGSEAYAFSHALDFVLALARDMSALFSRKISTVMFTDSKCPFDAVTKLSTVSEKRLLIDISAIRDSYTNSELSNVAHVCSKFNLAYVFTKEKADLSMLKKLMKTGYLNHPIS